MEFVPRVEISTHAIADLGRFPFDQIFRFVRLTIPRPSGSKFRAKMRVQTEDSYLCLLALGLLNDSEVKIDDVLGEGDNIPFIVRIKKLSATTFTVPLYFPDEFKSHFRLKSGLFTRAVMIRFHVAHMYFGTTHQSLLRPIHCNNVEVRYFSCLSDRTLILCLEA